MQVMIKRGSDTRFTLGFPFGARAIQRTFLLPFVVGWAIACGDGNDHQQRPDLRPLSSNIVCPGCGPYLLTICVGNDGNAAAEDFDVWVDTVPFGTFRSLAPGDQECLEARYGHTGPGPTALINVDPENKVEEQNEDNNTLAFPRPNPTGCDIICTPGPTPVPTHKAATGIERDLR